MNPDAARHTLRKAALEMGFDAAAWASARVPERDLGVFEAWIGAEMHAGMDYMPPSRERRANLRSSFAPTTSVLVLMVSHNHTDPGVPEGGTRLGRVARYAWSRDYHAVLRPYLEKLECIASSLHVQARAYVDHGPILERSLAVRAGLGWRGRSSQVISTSLGALTTLAVVLTDLKPPEEPDHPDRCGRCTACIPACPTDAITPERLVDSRLCVAYYTVEHRGAVPHALREQFGDHLFGCDDCLDICPWTSHAGQFSGLLEPDAELAHPNLEPFFTLTSHKFDKLYKGTAFVRARRKGMARNAAIVLGNMGQPEHAWLLEHGLNDVGWEVREACAWALARLLKRTDDVRILTALERALNDPDERVTRTAQDALKRTW
jgi:epoxyqueuosine reductase